jgi:hypothetical protein
LDTFSVCATRQQHAAFGWPLILGPLTVAVHGDHPNVDSGATTVTTNARKPDRTRGDPDTTCGRNDLIKPPRCNRLDQLGRKNSIETHSTRGSRGHIARGLAQRVLNGGTHRLPISGSQISSKGFEKRLRT